jgi:hypothetical protein
MKMHRKHTALFVFASWLVVGCGSNLTIGDAAPAQAKTPPSESANAPTTLPSPSAPPPVTRYVPCPSGPLCWANTDSTSNTFVSSWADVGDVGVWAVTRHGEVVYWDGARLATKHRIDGTFDDALVWGTGPDNVYAFFHHSKTSTFPDQTTIVRLHDGTWQVQPSSGAYRIGALRTVDAPSLGIAAILSRADDPSSVALVDADLAPKMTLPRLPTLDESFDAAAYLGQAGEPLVWILTKTGRVFTWAQGSSGWTEVTPFPSSGDANEIFRGTGIAPARFGYGRGVRVFRDVFEADRQKRREFATVLEGTSVETRTNDGRRRYELESILPHGRSVSYNPYPGISNDDAPLVDAGNFCWSLGCTSNGSVDSIAGGGAWANTVMPMDGPAMVLGSTRSIRYFVGAGGAVFTRPRSSIVQSSLESLWARKAGKDAVVSAIDALSDADVWVLERYPSTVRHYDGKTWSDPIRAPDGDGKMLATRDGVWVSSTEESRVSLLKAGTWTSHPIGGRVTAFAKDGVNGDTWALAYSSAPDGSGRTHLYHWDGSTWSRVGDPFGDSTAIGSIAAARGVVWAGGTSIYRREGGAPSRLRVPACRRRTCALIPSTPSRTTRGLSVTLAACTAFPRARARMSLRSRPSASKS